jgi:hypothetical protein
MKRQDESGGLYDEAARSNTASKAHDTKKRTLQ